MRRPRRNPVPVPTGGPARVLIVSASMGAGHDGAARSLAGQLRDRGQVAEVKDFLRSGPLRIGSALRAGYEFELRHVPSAYDATYRLWYRVPWLCPVVAWLVSALTRRRVLRWVDETAAQVVVSTYPLSTLALGRLRATGRLGVPVVNFITDFGVHPLWVHPGVDLNLAVHPVPARDAGSRSGRPSIHCGPAVSESFAPTELPDREEARRLFGIGDDERAVLIVAGSWGVGDVASTYRAVTASGEFLAVVVCGRDERLRRHVDALAAQAGRRSVVLGWSDRMPALMAACDAMVENAGGLTSLEAMSAGLPVVSFEPIAGHGVENTAAMDRAGVARLASSPDDLTRLLREVTAPGPVRRAQVDAARSMFRSVPAEAVLDVAAGAHVTQPDPRRLRPARLARRVLVAVAGTAALSWTGLTSGVALATDAGAGVLHPPKGSGPVAYVGVKVTSAELADPAVVDQIESMHVSAVVDDTTAQTAAPLIRLLVDAGVPVANGGFGETTGAPRGDLPWQRASADARAGNSISRLIGVPVTQTVTGRRLTAWDLIDCRDAHTSIVVPDHILHPGHRGPGTAVRIEPHRIYLVDGTGTTPDELAAYLSELRAGMERAQVAPDPLAPLA